MPENPGRVAQWESAVFTSRMSQVQSLPCPPFSWPALPGPPFLWPASPGLPFLRPARFLAGLLLLSALFATPLAAQVRTVLDGAGVQGGLVVGRTEPGAVVRLDDTVVRVGAGGDFVFGLGRDAAARAVLVIRYGDGFEETRSLEIGRRDYDIQRIDGVAPRFVAPPPETAERIQQDRVRIGAARREFRDPGPLPGRFIWPLAGPVTGVYGSQRIFNGEPRRPHFGLDIAAPEGAAIVAPAAGRVRLTHDLYFSGNSVILDHGHGVTTTYIHMSAIDVEEGEVLAQGDLIGRVGSTGRATGPHLHLGLNWYALALDPALLLGPPPE